MWKKCYEMKLGELLENQLNTVTVEKLLRVPGGWIYIYADTDGVATTFVPFDNEFMRGE